MLIRKTVLEPSTTIVAAGFERRRRPVQPTLRSRP